MNNDKIAETLGLEPLSGEVLPAVKNTNEVDDDYHYARTTMISVLEKGQEALDGIMDIANRTGTPRSYEVVSDLVKTISATSKDLLELAQRKKDLQKSDGPSTVNNNLFIGSSAELLKLLKKNNEQE